MVEVRYCSHPIPDDCGVKGVKRMLDVVRASPDDSLVITLISGGGSALMPLPAEEIDLSDIKKAGSHILCSCLKCLGQQTIAKMWG